MSLDFALKFNVWMMRMNALFIGTYIGKYLIGTDESFTPWAILIAVFCIFVHYRNAKYYHEKLEQENGNKLD